MLNNYYYLFRKVKIKNQLHKIFLLQVNLLHIKFLNQITNCILIVFFFFGNFERKFSTDKKKSI